MKNYSIENAKKRNLLKISLILKSDRGHIYLSCVMKPTNPNQKSRYLIVRLIYRVFSWYQPTDIIHSSIRFTDIQDHIGIFLLIANCLWIFLDLKSVLQINYKYLCIFKFKIKIKFNNIVYSSASRFINTLVLLKLLECNRITI